MDVGEAIGTGMKELTAGCEMALALEKKIYFKWQELQLLQLRWKAVFAVLDPESKEMLRSIIGRSPSIERLYITRKGLKAIKHAPESDKDIDWS